MGPQKVERRIAMLYNLERRRSVRQSYGNEQVLSLCREKLEKPGLARAHALLHARYEPRGGSR